LFFILDGLILRPFPSNDEEMMQTAGEQEIRRWREAEALAALQAARRSRNEGNIRKAKSIIEVRERQEMLGLGISKFRYFKFDFLIVISLF
jgi:hypothetical protein